MPVSRVLMTADAVGGVWPYTLDLARGLVAHGLAVDVAVMGPPPDGRQRADACAAGVTLFDLPGRLEWMDDPWIDVDRAGETLLTLARARRPDIVHLNGYCHAALRWSVPVVVVAHSCVRSWWRAVHDAAAPPAFDEYGRRVAAGLRAAATVIAPSRAMLRDLQREYEPVTRAAVIANGRAELSAAPAPKERLVFTAGRLWDEAKNIQAVCSVAPQVTWPTFVAGDDCDPHGRTAIRSGARYLGKLPPDVMAGWYARASIYALPARYEPFGLSILEAARAGCALVLGDIPSLRENWDGASRFVLPGDRIGLAAAIRTLIDDDARRRRLAAAAIARAATLPVDRMVAEYVAAYAAVAPAEAA